MYSSSEPSNSPSRRFAGTALTESLEIRFAGTVRTESLETRFAGGFFPRFLRFFSPFVAF
eukprot:UN11525